MKSFFIFAFSILFLSACHHSENIPVEENTTTSVDLLQGKWISLDDKKSVIEFINNQKMDIYAGKKMSASEFQLHDKFPVEEGDIKNENGKYLIVGENEEVFGYNIIELSDKNLTLMYLPRGNILKYEKILK